MLWYILICSDFIYIHCTAWCEPFGLFHLRFQQRTTYWFRLHNRLLADVPSRYTGLKSSSDGNWSMPGTQSAMIHGHAMRLGWSFDKWTFFVHTPTDLERYMKLFNQSFYLTSSRSRYDDASHLQCLHWMCALACFCSGCLLNAHHPAVYAISQSKHVPVCISPHCHVGMLCLISIGIPIGSFYSSSLWRFTFGVDVGSNRW